MCKDINQYKSLFISLQEILFNVALEHGPLIHKGYLFYFMLLFCLFHTFNPFWEKIYRNPLQFFSDIPRGVPLPHSNVLQYYVKRMKCKLNDVIFPSGC